MFNEDRPSSSLPDVASLPHASGSGVLDWVGMDGMEMPVQFDAGDGQVRQTSARVGAFVNLAKEGARGIHMSRLYLLVDEALSAGPVDETVLRKLLESFLASHEGLSDAARVVIHFEQLIRRRALRSDNSGWRAYPVRLEAVLAEGKFSMEIGTDVVYSSTCPASAALSRQMIQQRFAEDFKPGQPLEHEVILRWLGTEKGIVATPHAQRSTAKLCIRPALANAPKLLAIIDAVEASLGTAVQTAVKREDEQAFALANGANLMFCEDAARRVQQTLDAMPGIADFHVRIAHHESLHPHDAVAYAGKGLT
jgi:GTP cyclohydrolase I